MKIRVLHSGVVVEEMERNLFCVCLSILPVPSFPGTRIILPDESLYRCVNLQLSKASSNSVNYLDALQKEPY